MIPVAPGGPAFDAPRGPRFRAHAVLFLASGKASHITGHTLAVAGGR